METQSIDIFTRAKVLKHTDANPFCMQFIKVYTYIFKKKKIEVQKSAPSLR